MTAFWCGCVMPTAEYANRPDGWVHSCPPVAVASPGGAPATGGSGEAIGARGTTGRGERPIPLPSSPLPHPPVSNGPRPHI